MAAAALISALFLSPLNPSKSPRNSSQELPRLTPRLLFKHRKLPFSTPILSNGHGLLERVESVSSNHLSAAPVGTRNYEFLDSVAEVELRLDIGDLGIQSSGDIFVDVDETSLLIRVKASGSLINLMEANHLFEKIKPSETIWYIDEDQLVVNLKKYDTELKWPDIKESWGSLTSGIPQLLKGTSIYIIGDSTEINREVARELAMGIGYTPLYTRVVSEGADSVAEAEGAVLDGLSSHVRAVVATLGGLHGASRRPDKWRHLYAGFTIWLSKSEAPDEASAKEEVRRHIQDGSLAYTNAEVVVKLGGWDPKHARDVDQGCLSALKQLILSDKQLTGKKSLYIRLGCRGDWPNIKPPGWDPSSGVDPSP